MKKLFALILALGLILSGLPALAEGEAVTATSEETQEAKYLEYALRLDTAGFFKGTDKGYELERPITRIESAVMLVRMLGVESEVVAGTYANPFSDVPTWAQKYVGYLYEKKLTYGSGGGKFGSNDLTSANSYYTFCLRALGYDDSKGDFTYTEAVNKAAEFGVIGLDEASGILGLSSFLRDDAAYATAKTLSAKMKGSETQLVFDMASRGVTDPVCAEIVTGTNKAYNLYIAPQVLNNWTEEFRYDIGNKTLGMGFLEVTKLDSESKTCSYVYSDIKKTNGVFSYTVKKERNYFNAKWYEKSTSDWYLIEDMDFYLQKEDMFDSAADSRKLPETAEHDYTFFKNMVVTETSSGIEASYLTNGLAISLNDAIASEGDLDLNDKNIKRRTVVYLDKNGNQTGYLNEAEITKEDGTVYKLTVTIKDINRTKVTINDKVKNLTW